ncbi:MAG: hypothetical protein GX423_10225 [Nitrospiraceae bacterium]|jgi:anti-sigma factor RsiW|nr:hypothetical protein [Nitrospiraceae bacterium]
MLLDHEQVRTLLPDYLNGSLGHEARTSMAEHLAACEECSAELAVLEELAGVNVPDPGDLFWAALPKRIVAQVERPVPWWKGLLAAIMRPAPLAAVAALLLAVMLVPFATHYVGPPDRKEGGILSLEQIDLPKQQVQEIARTVATSDQEVSALLDTDENSTSEYQQVIASLSADELDELVQELQKTGNSGGDA